MVCLKVVQAEAALVIGLEAVPEVGLRDALGEVGLEKFLVFDLQPAQVVGLKVGQVEAAHVTDLEAAQMVAQPVGQESLGMKFCNHLISQNRISGSF